MSKELTPQATDLFEIRDGKPLRMMNKSEEHHEIMHVGKWYPVKRDIHGNLYIECENGDFFEVLSARQQSLN